MKFTEVIKRPLVTEKALASREGTNCYSFVVDRRAEKTAIKASVEQLFKVHVTRVNTALVRGKYRRVGHSIGRRPNYKKAIVWLKGGEKIELFEGV